MTIVTPFGTMPDGKEVKLYTMTNAKGSRVTLSDLGASIRDIVVPDRDGRPTDVSMCHQSFEDSVVNEGYMGATCGRVANRIRNARFTLGGREYKLESKHDKYVLHGGKVGLSHRVWDAETPDGGTVVFRLRSPDGDQGFPGTLDVTATYTWDDDNRLGIDYKAVTDADTIINLTNHVYFNLNGSGKITDHILRLDCDFYLPTDETVCVSGEILKTAGTVMDFSEPHAIGDHLLDDLQQLKNGLGYDFSYVLRQGEGVRQCARVTGPKTGITLDTYTDYPAVHLYTGNNLAGYRGKYGAVYRQYDAFCLETQLFPDFINCPAFTKHILKPGMTYHYHTDYVFSAE